MVGLNTSDKGIELIKREEGVCLRPKPCQAGYMTIGVGHKIEAGEKWPDEITMAQADALLQSDLKRFEAVVGKLEPAPEQREFDAMVSMAFNIGVAAFAASSTRKRWPNRGASADAMLIWCCAKDPKTGRVVPHPDLAGRRWRERAMFLGATEEKTWREAWKDYQRALAELGYYPGPFDGIPGPRTMAAVERLREYVADGGVV
jgi:lysozyme